MIKVVVLRNFKARENFNKEHQKGDVLSLEDDYAQELVNNRNVRYKSIPKYLIWQIKQVTQASWILIVAILGVLIQIIAIITR